MNRGGLHSVFWTFFAIWVYLFPYQWWLTYSELRSDSSVPLNPLSPVVAGSNEFDLPPPFYGKNLEFGDERKIENAESKVAKSESSPDVAGPILDEVKVCFVHDGVNTMTARGGMSSLVEAFKGRFGSDYEEILLEKKANMVLADGSAVTLVYEWIGEEEGSDVYWYELDEEGYPKPRELADDLPRDLSGFEQMTAKGRTTRMLESRLIELSNGIQIGLEKVDGVMSSVSLRSGGNLIKCRMDPVKTYVCECLN